MNISARIALAANTVIIVIGFASGKTATGLGPSQTLTIRLYDQAQVRAGVLRSATGQASRLFLAAGIRINWEQPSAETPEDRGSDFSAASLQSDNRGYLVVRLLRRIPASVSPAALGFALPFALHGAHISIFYDRIEALSNTLNAAPGILLGHAMAHEIGHCLLGSSEHLAGGFMQGRWSPDTLRLASAGLLAFRREETERMGRGVMRFQVRQPIPQPQTTLAAAVIRKSPE